MLNNLTTKLVTVLMLGIVLLGSNTSAYASKSLETPTNLADTGINQSDCLDSDIRIVGSTCDSTNY